MENYSNGPHWSKFQEQGVKFKNQIYLSKRLLKLCNLSVNLDY